MPRIALAQMSMSGEISVNLERGQRAIAAAAADGADVVVFPELQLSPFFPQYPDFDAEPNQSVLDGEEIRALQGACDVSALVAVAG